MTPGVDVVVAVGFVGASFACHLTEFVSDVRLDLSSARRDQFDVDVENAPA